MAIELISNIAPKNAQKFWLLDTIYGKGGKIEVPTYADLLAIPLANRKKDMWGITQDTGEAYSCDLNLDWQPLQLAGGERIFYKITQTAHAFVLGDIIGYNGVYIKSLAKNTQDTDVIGIVSKVIDTNNFEITLAGRVSLVGYNTYTNNVAAPIVANTTYLLSANTPGRLELTPSTSIGDIQKAVLITLSNTVGIVRIGTGAEITPEPTGTPAGYNLIKKDGNNLTQRSALNFTGVNVNVTDVAGVTTVSVNSSGLGNFSGDITNSGPDNLVTTINNSVVTNVKLATVAANTIKGALAAGNPVDLSVLQVKTMLGIASGTVNRIAKFNSATSLGDSSIIDNGSNLTLSYLAGTGLRMVVADASGILSTQVIPTGGGAGGGISSLNGLTTSPQVFALGSSGNSPAFTSTASTHTLNIPLASAAGVTSGTISKAQYDIFNAKVDGSGTVNTLSKFTSAGIIGNSRISDDGSTVAVSTDITGITGNTFSILRLREASNANLLQLSTYGPSILSQHWSGLNAANTSEVFAGFSSALVVKSTNGIFFSGSALAEHMKLDTVGDVTIKRLGSTGPTISGGGFSGYPTVADSSGKLITDKKFLIREQYVDLIDKTLAVYPSAAVVTTLPAYVVQNTFLAGTSGVKFQVTMNGNIYLDTTHIPTVADAGGFRRIYRDVNGFLKI